jgi:hypothetical protein
MSHLVRARASAKTPMERIFEKVMHRKMTSQERIYFHLKRQIKPPPKVKASKHRHSRAA